MENIFKLIHFIVPLSDPRLQRTGQIYHSAMAHKSAYHRFHKFPLGGASLPAFLPDPLVVSSARRPQERCIALQNPVGSPQGPPYTLQVDPAHNHV